MAAKVPQSKRDAQQQRRQQVAALRLHHLSQRQIADRLGVGIGTVNRDLKAIRDEWRERAATAYRSWLAEEVAKLDALERGLMTQALKGDVKAVDRLLAVMQRRAKMLGLDEPQQHEITMLSRDLVDAEIERLEAELGDADREAGAAS